MKKTLATTALVALALLSACSPAVEGGPSEDGGDAPQSSSSAPAGEAPVETPASSEPVAEPPAEDVDSGAVKIGEGVYAYEDGLTVEITGLAPYQPSEFAFGADTADSAITFVVTVTNGTSEPVDLAITTVNVNAGAAGTTAEQIFDAEVGTGFEGTVLPGKASSATYAYAVNAADLAEIVIEVEPGFLEYDSAFFEGALA